MKKKNYFEYLYLIILGALTSFSLPPYNFILINFFTFSLFFFYIFKKKNKYQKVSFLYGWLFGFGYFLSSLYWVSISLSFDQNFKYLIPIAILVIPSFLAIFYGVVTYCFFLIKTKKLLCNLFLFSLLFGMFEYLRGNILTGFPWNLIAYSFLNYLEVIQIVSVIGIYAFNTLCISLFVSPALFLLKKKNKETIIGILLLLSPIASYFSGLSKINSFQSLELIKNDYVIRSVSSKIELDRFYLNVNTMSVIEELIELSDPNFDNKTLFIWPEGIIPNINQSELVKFDYLFNKKFNENHIIAIGINSLKSNNNNNKFYNSLSIYNNKLKVIDSYNKVNLVPFGEFLPFEKMLKKIHLKSLTNNYQSFSSGENRKIIKINENGFNIKILPLICYEIIYSGRIYESSDFDYIINISEDGWFGNSIGPHQHFTHSVFRAVESGKYIIRSANNGIAAIINPVGIIEKKISFGETGYIDLTEKRVLDTTLFSQHGNKMFLILIFLYILLIFSFNRIS